MLQHELLVPSMNFSRKFLSTKTRNSAIADKPCDAFRDINLWKIPWPWNRG